MASRYVSNNSTGNPLGSNSYNGLSPTVDGGGVGPWLTPEYGMSNMGGGNTLEIRGGVYDWARATAFTDIPNGSAIAWTRVQNYNNETVEHHHAGTWAKLLNFDNGARTYVYIEFVSTIQDGMIFDMEDQLGMGQAIKYATPTSRVGNPNHHLRFENLWVRNSVDSGLLGYRCTDIWLTNLTVSNNGDSGGDHGAYINDTRCTVRGGRYYGNSGWGVHQWNSAITDLLIENTVCYANGRGGIITAGGAIGAITVQNNTVYDHATSEGWGITSYGTDGTKIFHNTCHGNLHGIFIGTGSGGGNNSNVANNLSAGNITQDINIYSTSSGVICKDNRTTKTILNSGTGTTLTRNIASIAASTEFVDYTNATKALRNYRLKAGATSINPVNVTTVGVGHDAKGVIRPQGGIPDPGMDEYRVGLWDAPGPWVDSGLDNRTIRFLVRGADIGATVTTIKLFLRGRSTGSGTVTGVSIAERSGATLDIVTATNEQVTFGGTWAAGVTVLANTEVGSDAMAIDFNPTKDYFVTFHIATGQPSVYSSTAEGTTSWHVVGSNETATLNWSGLTITETREFPYLVARIEETIEPPIPPSAPGISVNLSQIVVAGTLHALVADASDQDGNIVTGYVLNAAGIAGLDFDPSGATITHKTS